MSGNYYFVIVGQRDNPLFEMEFTPPGRYARNQLNTHPHGPDGYVLSRIFPGIFGKMTTDT